MPHRIDHLRPVYQPVCLHRPVWFIAHLKRSCPPGAVEGPLSLAHRAVRFSRYLERLNREPPNVLSRGRNQLRPWEPTRPVPPACCPRATAPREAPRWAPDSWSSPRANDHAGLGPLAPIRPTATELRVRRVLQIADPILAGRLVDLVV